MGAGLKAANLTQNSAGAEEVQKVSESIPQGLKPRSSLDE
jgi:hypothetical protein